MRVTLRGEPLLRSNPSTAKIGIPEASSATAISTSGEPRATDAAMRVPVPRRNSVATIVVDQNALPLATEGVVRWTHSRPIVVSAKNTRYPKVVKLVSRSYVPTTANTVASAADVQIARFGVAERGETAAREVGSRPSRAMDRTMRGKTSTLQCAVSSAEMAKRIGSTVAARLAADHP